MRQRVGVAHALWNSPDVLFVHEPMSGLDPLGRREIKQLILRLRHRGCTVFFSSHVLSDAEALCSRVAIMAKGRLVTSGSLSDLQQFQARGWELIMSGVSEVVLERARTSGDIVSISRLGDDRVSLEIPLAVAPERVLAELVAHGGQLQSLTPLRESLEEFFVREVAAAPGDARLERAS
jgi:ABC-2 type transport system ATP-binding protein